ncbi:MAG TPA: cysteine--1-D-myo-inosityl 2-amino-2-deoxy-alpha-D-glucopyranoside ligase [Mycobacteriales bacterium]|nr:cysteine--1-D-myo-inosityl 2-amino-2-deoxy-alpha-D-glucopyranoside ligase [Mycobacteriales bacterium]
MESWAAPSVPALPVEPAAPPLRLHDTATGETRPLAPGPVATMYVCGITPYDATHLGHALTYVTYDLIGRVLRDAGVEVRYTQNVTDVDDPLLVRANETGEDWRDLAAREIALFREDMAALRVLPPTSYIGAVESMDLVNRVIERLEQAGATYELDGDTYFAVSTAPSLGQVAHLSRDDMVTIARERGGDPDRTGKKDPLDPLVWQAARAGEPSWPSPHGEGRPGWHVECAAIALDTLGETIDIQGGGTDLIFPHHELGAAEAEVATGVRPFARFFVHTAMLELDGHKMSKSRGNLVFVSKLRASGVDPAAIRLGLLSEHYRTAWEWTPATLTAAEARLATWRDAVARPTGPGATAVLAEVRRALSDDLDAPQALRAIDQWAAQAVGAGGTDADAPALVRAAVDALLGVAL